jgi:hypothetical protein
MARPKVWAVIPALAISPNKTFFGLDKNAAHCFTIHQLLYPFFNDPEHGGRWGISSYNKQVQIRFVILDKEYPAELRLSVQDRSKVRVREPDSLPERTVYQFQWSKFEETVVAIKTAFPEAYKEVELKNSKHLHRIVFHHLGNDVFLLRASMVGEEFDSTMISV